MPRFIVKLAFLAIPVLFIFGFSTAQDLPSCSERELAVDYPRADPALWCLEILITDEAGGEMAFTALAVADDGIVYATRPLFGEVYALADSDGDALLDTSTLIAENLRLPNGLAYADDVLYIMGDGIVYRYSEGETTVLVDDLPHGRGFMASGITVHDNRLYVGIPFPCDFCLPDDELQGTVLSYALDGTDRQIVARGLRYPAALLFYEGQLWVTDTAQDNLPLPSSYDELNTIDLNTDSVPHFGFPFCYGADNSPNMPSDFDCAEAKAPTLYVETNSTPIALEVYDSDLFRFLTGDLMVVFGGSFDNRFINGYSIYTIDMERDDGRIRYEPILPADPVIATTTEIFYNPAIGLNIAHSRIVNQRGAGIWPHRLYGVAVSPEGWIYFSANSRIYVLRPSLWDICGLEYRECD